MSNTSDIDHDETVAACDVESILSIHRQPDGYIGFVRKPDPDAPPRLDKYGKPYTFENLFSIRTGDLEQMFPSIVDWLTHDAYMTVNAYHRPAHWNNSQTSLPDVCRKEKHLRYLNACYADIDCGRPESDEAGADLSWRQAQYEAGVLADMGVIPQPSIMARSGRGVYLFWLLVDHDDPTIPQKAWPEKIDKYKQINKALIEKIRSHRLPADINASDAARVLRVPGSIHRKALRRATYIVQLDQAGKGYTYDLPELASFLDLPEVSHSLPEVTQKNATQIQYRKTINKGSQPARARGSQALNAMRASDIFTLSKARGGFSKRGQKHIDDTTSAGRRFILSLYAFFIKGSGASLNEATKAVEALAADMNPPWPDEPADPTIEALVKAEYDSDKPRRWSNKKLCGLLGISSSIARELDLKTIVTEEVRQERDNAMPLQKEVIRERRKWLLQYITEHPTPSDGGRWTARKVRDRLTFAPFTWNNHETANQDLNEIGYINHRSKGGRQRKAYNG